MKEIPILFSTPMVQAILAGRKTQTRRVVKDKLLQSNKDEFEEEFLLATMAKCPYGQVGDVLWVRETFGQGVSGKYYYKTKNDMVTDELAEQLVIRWKSPRFMTKNAARIWLRITNVRVERLQDISEEDAVAEGVDNWTWKNMATPQNWMDYTDPTSPPLCSAYDSFCSLWDSINGEQSWNDNPWVWVIKFERIEKP